MPTAAWALKAFTVLVILGCAQSQLSVQYTVQEATDYQNDPNGGANDLISSPSSSVGMCALLCSILDSLDTPCAGFVYNTGTGWPGCYLKSLMVVSTANGISTSYVKMPTVDGYSTNLSSFAAAHQLAPVSASNSPNQLAVPSTELPDELLFPQPEVVSADICAAVCNALPSCTSFVYTTGFSGPPPDAQRYPRCSFQRATGPETAPEATYVKADDSLMTVGVPAPTCNNVSCVGCQTCYAALLCASNYNCIPMSQYLFTFACSLDANNPAVIWSGACYTPTLSFSGSLAAPAMRVAKTLALCALAILATTV